MSDSYVNVSLSDSLLQNYDTGSYISLFSEYPNGNYSDNSLAVSSSHVTEAFPSSNSHSSYFKPGTVKRETNYDKYELINYGSNKFKIAQNVTTNNRNWRILASDVCATHDTVVSGSGNDTISYVDVVSSGGGNDVITIKGGFVRSGTGDDYIYCSSTDSINEENIVVFEAQNGNDTIDGHVDKIQWETGFTGLSVNYHSHSYYSNRYVYDLGLHSGSDSITLKTNDDFVEIINSDGNEIAQIYLESTFKSSGLIDGSKYSSLEVLIGNSGSDTIKAGSGGSSLWGGMSADDSMVGGAGSDYFFYGDNDGIDYIANSNAADRVVLYGSLSFQYISQNGNDLVIQYAPDNKLTVQNWSENGMNSFQIFDGSVWGIHFENGNPTYYRKG